MVQAHVVEIFGFMLDPFPTQVQAAGGKPPMPPAAPVPSMPPIKGESIKHLVEE